MTPYSDQDTGYSPSLLNRQSVLCYRQCELCGKYVRHMTKHKRLVHKIEAKRY